MIIVVIYCGIVTTWIISCVILLFIFTIAIANKLNKFWKLKKINRQTVPIPFRINYIP